MTATPELGAGGAIGDHHSQAALLEMCLKEGERLAQLNQFKSDFLNMVAHDLNNVITPMLISQHVLKEGLEEGQLAACGRSVALLGRGLDRLTGFLADLLDSARLQSGQLEIKSKTFDLGDQLRASVAVVRPEAETKGITVDTEIEGSALVFASPLRIEQVTSNLLSNAVKFTPGNGRIVVRMAQDADGVEFVVSDTGAGLRPTDLPLLFQPFSRLAPTTQGKHTGTGLGLFICRGIVELHAGRIWCESAGPGKGATFHVWLPRAAPMASPGPTPCRVHSVAGRAPRA